VFAVLGEVAEAVNLRLTSNPEARSIQQLFPEAKIVTGPQPFIAWPCLQGILFCPGSIGIFHSKS
jgi:hypothetical protein